MIIGHERQLGRLEVIARSGKVPHAFIFAGPDHLGKRLVALAFFYLCARPRSSAAGFFGEDPLARAFREGHHPDLFLLSRAEDKKEIGIGQIRELKRFVGLSPFELERKFVLIDDAQTISAEAANSLLKTLEEPAGETTIVLLTSRPASLPATIISRALRINFYPLSDSAVAAGIEGRAESIGVNELAWIAGRPGLAIIYLRDPKDKAVFGRRESFKAFSQALRSGSIRQRLALAEEVAADEAVLDILESWIAAARPHLFKQDGRSFLKLIKRLEQTRELLQKTNVNIRLQLQDTLLSVEPI